MNTCITIETLDNYYSDNLSKKSMNIFYKHIASCDNCRQKFVAAGELIHACKDMEWAQTSPAEARQLITKLMGDTPLVPPIIHKIINWITETFPLSTNSLLLKEAALAPVVTDDFRMARRADPDSIKYSIFKLGNEKVILNIYAECESNDPFSFGLNILNVQSINQDPNIRIILRQGKRQIFSRLYQQGQPFLKTGLPENFYKLTVKQNAQEIYQFNFEISEKGIVNVDQC